VLERLRRIQSDERGFTLIEVLVVVVLMGIVLGIATYTWFGVIRSRNVDSATNQITADLRLAHSQATNRLAEYSFVAPADPVPAGVDPLSTYETGPTGKLHRLPDGTQIQDTTTVVFEGDGEAQVTGANPITVRSAGDANNNSTIEINALTSRVRVVP